MSKKNTETLAKFDSKLSFMQSEPKVTPCSLEIEYEWLDSVQAARYLKVSVESLRNMTSNGVLPVYKLGNRNRYRTESLRSLLLATEEGASYGNS